MSSKDSRITDEVDGRLDDLFGDEGGDDEGDMSGNREEKPDRGPVGGVATAPPKPPPSAQNPGANPTQALISELKSVVLSLEWEITDEVMIRLGEEVDRLKKTYENDKIVVAFLQLLDSLGKYIQKKKAEAHPESITLLNSVYENLEQVLLSGELSDAEKKKMLVAQVNEYKKLKEFIKTSSSLKPPTPRPKPKQPPYEEEDEERDEEDVDFTKPTLTPEPGGTTDAPPAGDMKEVVRMLRDIHETVKTEFGKLRKELVEALRER